jgi:hypothetical protein
MDGRGIMPCTARTGAKAILQFDRAVPPASDCLLKFPALSRYTCTHECAGMHAYIHMHSCIRNHFIAGRRF